MDDGQCFFEASSFKPRSFPDITEIVVWTYKMMEPVKPVRPYPKQTKFQQRKERHLQMKAQRKGKV